MVGANCVVRKSLAKVASDHLPVVVDFQLCPGEERAYESMPAVARRNASCHCSAISDFR